jgi:hypothetical protein
MSMNISRVNARQENIVPLGDLGDMITFGTPCYQEGDDLYLTVNTVDLLGEPQNPDNRIVVNLSEGRLVRLSKDHHCVIINTQLRKGN